MGGRSFIITCGVIGTLYSTPLYAAAVRIGLLQSQGITSMNFPACPLGQRRPKLNERQGTSKIKRKDEATPSLSQSGQHLHMDLKSTPTNKYREK